MTFASCANSSDSDDESPSPSLPENVGENPIKETVRLKQFDSSNRYLELKSDGTALSYFYSKEYKKCIEAEYSYSFNIDKREIYMVVKKISYNEDEVMTYNEILSKINEDCEEDIRQYIRDDYKARFGAQITYNYKIDDGKMTLTEKFTGINNLNYSNCKFGDSSSSCEIACMYAKIIIEEDNVRIHYGSVDIPKSGRIDFIKSKRSKSDKDYETIGNVTATYTEDISGKTVTINCEGKEYVCEFVGQKFVQE